MTMIFDTTALDKKICKTRWSIEGSSHTGTLYPFPLTFEDVLGPVSRTDSNSRHVLVKNAIEAQLKLLLLDYFDKAYVDGFWDVLNSSADIDDAIDLINSDSIFNAYLNIERNFLYDNGFKDRVDLWSDLLDQYSSSYGDIVDMAFLNLMDDPTDKGIDEEVSLRWVMTLKDLGKIRNWVSMYSFTKYGWDNATIGECGQD